jgi:hypothetical protein
MVRPQDSRDLRLIRQAVPVAGSFAGATGDYLGMTVNVAVCRSAAPKWFGATSLWRFRIALRSEQVMPLFRLFRKVHRRF